MRTGLQLMDFNKPVASDNSKPDCVGRKGQRCGSKFRCCPPAISRYTGKERDEETGLSYRGARNDAPWLARWTSLIRLVI